MICPRCGTVNRPERVSCVHCWGPVAGLPPAHDARCADHPAAAASGQCVICRKLVCDSCGGIYQGSAVYCIAHAQAAMTGALGKARPVKAAPAAAPVAAATEGEPAQKKRGLFGKKK